MKIRTFWGNQYRKPWVIKLFRRIKITGATLAILFLMFWSAYFSVKLQPAKISYANTVIYATSTPELPVLDRIAKCESGNSHYAKSGQVLIKTNTDGSYDIGYFQINSVWSKQAAKLGFDLTKENDNKEFGMWLFAHYGSEPWYSSIRCWQN